MLAHRTTSGNGVCLILCVFDNDVEITHSCSPMCSSPEWTRQVRSPADFLPYICEPTMCPLDFCSRFKLSTRGIKKRQALRTRRLSFMTYFRFRYLSQTKIEFLYAKCLCPGFSRVEFLTSNATTRLELKFLNRICHLVVTHD